MRPAWRSAGCIAGSPLPGAVCRRTRVRAWRRRGAAGLDRAAWRRACRRRSCCCRWRRPGMPARLACCWCCWPLLLVRLVVAVRFRQTVLSVPLLPLGVALLLVVQWRALLRAVDRTVAASGAAGRNFRHERDRLAGVMTWPAIRAAQPGWAACPMPERLRVLPPAAPPDRGRVRRRCARTAARPAMSERGYPGGRGDAVARGLPLSGAPCGRGSGAAARRPAGLRCGCSAQGCWCGASRSASCWSSGRATIRCFCPAFRRCRRWLPVTR